MKADEGNNRIVARELQVGPAPQNRFTLSDDERIESGAGVRDVRDDSVCGLDVSECWLATTLICRKLCSRNKSKFVDCDFIDNLEGENLDDEILARVS
jgi:hypothetical protein